MGKWKADTRIRLGGINIYKWIVPARVEGVWKWEGLDGQLYRVELRQKYQEVSGSAWQAGEAVHLECATLCGETLELGIRENEAAPLKNFTLDFENDELQSILEEA